MCVGRILLRAALILIGLPLSGWRATMPTTKSGGVRYDRISSQQVRLVTRLVRAGDSRVKYMWVVVYPDLNFKLVDLGIGAEVKRLFRQPRQPNPKMMPVQSQAE